jgi:hypothetical protein
LLSSFLILLFLFFAPSSSSSSSLSSSSLPTRHLTLQCRHKLLGPSSQLGSPHRRHKRYQEGSGDDLGCYESYYGWVFVSAFRDSAGGRGGRGEEGGRSRWKMAADSVLLVLTYHSLPNYQPGPLAFFFLSTFVSLFTLLIISRNRTIGRTDRLSLFFYSWSESGPWTLDHHRNSNLNYVDACPARTVMAAVAELGPSTWNYPDPRSRTALHCTLSTDYERVG